jgi:type IX secretion system PorP/SprF family membrane protein
MIRKLLSISCATALTFSAFAQDPEFTQYYAAPIYTNPAMAGNAFCRFEPAGRFSINYRNQWPNLDGTFRTMAASFDQHVDELNGGIGFLATYDRAGQGLLTTTTFSAIYAYVLPVTKKFYIRAGLQATYGQKSLDFDKLKWADQIHPTRGFIYRTNEPLPADRVSYPNFGSGVIGYTDKFYAGFAVHNITEPVQSFYGTEDGIIPRRYTFHSGAVIPLDKRRDAQSTFSPNVLFMQQQNFTQLNLGFYANKGPLVTGLWFRQTFGEFKTSDAIMVLVGFRKDRFKFGYSYDITVSSARRAVMGSHEVSATLDWCLKKRPIRFKPMRCPEF